MCNEEKAVQAQGFANSRRGLEATKDKAFCYIEQDPHLMKLPHFIPFLIQQTPKPVHLQTGRIFNHYHILGTCKGIQQQRGCYFA